MQYGRFDLLYELSCLCEHVHIGTRSAFDGCAGGAAGRGFTSLPLPLHAYDSVCVIAVLYGTKGPYAHVH